MSRRLKRRIGILPVTRQTNIGHGICEWQAISERQSDRQDAYPTPQIGLHGQQHAVACIHQRVPRDAGRKKEKDKGTEEKDMHYCDSGSGTILLGGMRWNKIGNASKETFWERIAAGILGSSMNGRRGAKCDPCRTRAYLRVEGECETHETRWYFSDSAQVLQSTNNRHASTDRLIRTAGITPPSSICSNLDCSLAFFRMPHYDSVNPNPVNELRSKDSSVALELTRSMDQLTLN